MIICAKASRCDQKHDLRQNPKNSTANASFIGRGGGYCLMADIGFRSADVCSVDVTREICDPTHQRFHRSSVARRQSTAKVLTTTMKPTRTHRPEPPPRKYIAIMCRT